MKELYQRMKADISYGKHEISFYRSHPQSVLFAGRVRVDVLGDNFLPAYTEGDNRGVVATDTMKNFVHRSALAYPGHRLEGFARFLGERFLEQYPQMQRLRIEIRELAFKEHSKKLFSPLEDDYGVCGLEIDRDRVHDLWSGRRNLRLVKTTGSAFRDFARDQFTTLPEVADRPLFIHLDVAWRYADPSQALADAGWSGYRPRRDPDGPQVDSEDVRDRLIETFDVFVSMSIQHLVHEMGKRLLDRFPQMREVSFEAQNRLWDTVAVSETDPLFRVFADPRPAHGVIGLTLRRQ
jgi:urate oxidase / 2-oxo-4-hydroxy-4-carboxy-5-ureidoimidazoline decarboxylase